MSAVVAPDLDALVTSALREALPDATVMVLAPTDPQSRLPLITARQVSGGALNSRGLVTGTVDVQTMAAVRRDASLLSRRAWAVLSDACAAQFADEDAHLCAFSALSGGPAEVRTGQPAPDVALFRFQFTCRITARTSP